MSGDQLSVDPVQLRRLADAFRESSQQTAATLNRLRSAMTNVEPSWQGAARDHFFAEYQQWECTLREFSQMLEAVGTQLDAFALDMRDTDESIAGEFRRIERGLGDRGR